MSFPFYKQQDIKDCGPTCLRMITRHYGRQIPIQRLRELCHNNRRGATLLGISEAAEKIGFRTSGVRATLEQLKQIELPCILHWRQNHYVVLHKIKKHKFYIADPNDGLIILKEDLFIKNWIAHTGTNNGIALLVEVSPEFYAQPEDEKSDLSWAAILKYFYAYKRPFFQLALGLLAGTLLALIAPFLTQSIVDIGINTKSINFVYLILIAQIMFFLGSTSVNFIRSWILLHISTRISIAILTDFLIKVLKLPISFFESKTTGDIMQRMNDQQRIESFLTGTALTTIFSAINLLVFTLVLLYYSISIFLVSVICTILYIIWINIFLKRRAQLNYKEFSNSTINQNTIMEMVKGIQEIKLYNSEKFKRWQWERVQAQVFKFKLQSLALTQYQQGGGLFINQIKNIIVTFLSVEAVIKGQMTLGGMMAIQYIVGQVSAPIEQMITFIQSYQDARISLGRLNEVHQLADEESAEKLWIKEIPDNRGVEFNNVTFCYPGAGNEPVLNNISFQIPEGKTTAIVGMSGSGKTTILKLLLRFYDVNHGKIRVGQLDLDNISFSSWRNSCGMVMQEGYIFSDTIANNIALGEEFPDAWRLNRAIEIASIREYIDQLPFGLHTKIGSDGKGLSQGQKQRLLIARAVYQDPQFVFFDEATNALDSNNERKIMENLNEFFIGKTVVVVAHRLSTVSNADNIIVVDKGSIVEQGSHRELTARKGIYYELVRNQLELGQ